MKQFLTLYILLSSILSVFASNEISDYSNLQKELQAYVKDKDARIGISGIINGKDTIDINGNQEFPLLSVYKFPQALAVAEYCRENNISFLDTIRIDKKEILPGTYSPLREKYGITNLSLPIKELLFYSLVESDNNACDILFKLLGGTQYADSIIHGYGFDNIHILNTEDEMHKDINLCYKNNATPLEMCRLMEFFNNELLAQNENFQFIDHLLKNCKTGADRLSKPLEPTNAVIKHKTGTGDINAEGRIIGINDMGYIELPNGNSYSIAVFISDSKYDYDTTSAFIADISEIFWRHLTNPNP